MLKVQIVEDDPADAKLLMGHLSRYGRERDTQIQASWCRSTLEFLEEAAPADLVLMDIQMPGINGMEAAEAFRQHDQTTPLAFVTNLAQYAVRGYEVDALGFVVKPVMYPDVALIVDKARRIAKREVRRALSVQTKDGLHTFLAGDLVYTEVRDHVLIHHVMGLEGVEEIETRGSLSAFEQKLGGSPFLRISNNTVVNMGHIRSVRHDCLVMTDGSTLWFSRMRRKDAMAAIAAYLGSAL